MSLVDLGKDLNSLRDSWWTFILPSICSFGVCANLINIYILTKLRKKNPTYKLMLYNSISNFLYSFSCFFVFMMRCGQYCKLQNTYIACLYEKYVYFYFSGVLGMFNVLIETIIAVQRYYIAANKKFTSEKKLNILLILIVLFSFGAYLPIIFTRDITVLSIETIKNQTIFKDRNITFYYIKNTIGNYVPIKLMYSGFTISRCLLVLMMLVFINILLLKKFDNHVNKKANFTNNNEKTLRSSRQSFSNEETLELNRKKSLKSKILAKKEIVAKKNMTRMVVWMGIVFFIGNIPHVIAYFLVTFTNFFSMKILSAFFILVSNTLLFSSHGVNILIYYFFNRNFREIFKFLVKLKFNSSEPSTGGTPINNNNNNNNTNTSQRLLKIRE